MPAKAEKMIKMCEYQAAVATLDQPGLSGYVVIVMNNPLGEIKRLEF